MFIYLIIYSPGSKGFICVFFYPCKMSKGLSVEVRPGWWRRRSETGAWWSLCTSNSPLCSLPNSKSSWLQDDQMRTDRNTKFYVVKNQSTLSKWPIILVWRGSVYRWSRCSRWAEAAGCKGTSVDKKWLLCPERPLPRNWTARTDWRSPGPPHWRTSPGGPRWLQSGQ